MPTTLASYRIVTADLTRSLRTTAARPQVAREVAYYSANIGKVKSIADFLKNDRLYRFAMKALGLEDMTYAKAFMKKVLTEGVDKSDSFANTLTDGRFKEFANVFNFARDGETATSFEPARQGTVDRYVRQSLEEDVGQRNEGVRLALYFQRKAPGLASTYGILADPALLKVVQTALALPPENSFLDVDRHAKLLADRLDIKDFKDPKKLERFLTRFTSLWELNNPSTGATARSIAIGPPLEAGIGASLLASLQNLRRGGS
ncbi:MAG TPA: DUF1217 domain-containing protein [Hyphomicrobiaceae bacterium]|nr:DUF1217 domain-containing protein [Hyphomicrobiaceae bacterium]